MGPAGESCYNCRRPLREADFRLGRAIRVGSLAACDRCAEPLLARLTPEQQRAALRGIGGPAPAEPEPETIPAEEPEPEPLTTRQPRSSPPRPPTVIARAPRAASGPAKPPVVWIAAAAAGAVLLLLVFLLGGDPGDPPPDPVRRPSTPRQPDRRPVAGPPQAPPKIDSGREAIAALEQEIRAAAEHSEYGKALARLESARAQESSPAWGQAVVRLTREIRDGARGRFIRLKPKALDARRLEDEDSVERIRAEIAAWGIPEFVGELDRELAAIPSRWSKVPAYPGIPAASFAGTKGPFDLDGDGAIRNWLLAGPFPNPGETGGFDIDYLGGEDRYVPRGGRSVEWKDLAPANWKPHAASRRIILMRKVPDLVLNGSRDHLLTYCACWLACETDIRCEIRVGSDDGYKLWLDHARIGTVKETRGYRHDQETYPARLAKGRHLLLFKLVQNNGGYQFGIRLVSPGGGPPRGVRVWN
jgi:hypothetical protein